MSPREVKITCPSHLEIADIQEGPLLNSGYGTAYRRCKVIYRPCYVPAEVEAIPLKDAPWAYDGKTLYLYTLDRPNGIFRRSPIIVKWDKELCSFYERDGGALIPNELTVDNPLCYVYRLRIKIRGSVNSDED